jgi:hypothetical protein
MSPAPRGPILRPMKRRLSPFASVLAIVALLFAQVMTSVHACDMEKARAALPAATATAPDGGDCCTPADTARDPACDNHCQQTAAPVDRAEAPLAVAPAGTGLAPPASLVPPATAPPVRLLSPDLARHTEPPISLRHCCFRI